MRPQVKLSSSGETLTVQIQLRLRKRGGRKLVVAPNSVSPWVPRRARVDGSLVKAIARAHRWRRMLEDGVYQSITELAVAENINQSYVCRILRLTLLSPRITEVILDGQQASSLELDRLLKPFPLDWTAQTKLFCEGREADGRSTQ